MSQFLIYAGRKFQADFTVVSDDGVTGEQLDPSDTATMSINTVGEDPVCVIAEVPMVIVDLDNGVFELTLTAEQTALLNQCVGFKEDNFAPMGNYTGFMEFNLVSGYRQAHITVEVIEAPC